MENDKNHTAAASAAATRHWQRCRAFAFRRYAAVHRLHRRARTLYDVAEEDYDHRHFHSDGRACDDDVEAMQHGAGTTDMHAGITHRGHARAKAAVEEYDSAMYGSNTIHAVHNKSSHLYTSSEEDNYKDEYDELRSSSSESDEEGALHQALYPPHALGSLSHLSDSRPTQSTRLEARLHQWEEYSVQRRVGNSDHAEETNEEERVLPRRHTAALRRARALLQRGLADTTATLLLSHDPTQPSQLQSKQNMNKLSICAPHHFSKHDEAHRVLLAEAMWRSGSFLSSWSAAINQSSLHQAGHGNSFHAGLLQSLCALAPHSHTSAYHSTPHFSERKDEDENDGKAAAAVSVAGGGGRGLREARAAVQARLARSNNWLTCVVACEALREVEQAMMHRCELIRRQRVTKTLCSSCVDVCEEEGMYVRENTYKHQQHNSINPCQMISNCMVANSFAGSSLVPSSYCAADALSSVPYATRLILDEVHVALARTQHDDSDGLCDAVCGCAERALRHGAAAAAHRWLNSLSTESAQTDHSDEERQHQQQADEEKDGMHGGHESTMHGLLSNRGSAADNMCHVHDEEVNHAHRNCRRCRTHNILGRSRSTCHNAMRDTRTDPRSHNKNSSTTCNHESGTRLGAHHASTNTAPVADAATAAADADADASRREELAVWQTRVVLMRAQAMYALGRTRAAVALLQRPPLSHRTRVYRIALASLHPKGVRYTPRTSAHVQRHGSDYLRRRHSHRRWWRSW